MAAAFLQPEDFRDYGRLGISGEAPRPFNETAEAAHLIPGAWTQPLWLLTFAPLPASGHAAGVLTGSAVTC